MGVLSAIVLGVVQGVTEFLPISSDGHLALAYHALGMKPDLTFEVFLHFATLIAMLIYFRADVVALARSAVSWRPDNADERRALVRIAGVTVVSAVVALTISPVVEPASESIPWIGAGFLLTAALLATGEAMARRRELTVEPSALPAAPVALIGVLQGLAALPGVSRSGSTISAGMFAGLSREKAARFSFLCGIPIIALAAAKDGLDLLSGSASLPGLPQSVAGFAAAAVAGYIAIAGLLGLVKRHGLWVFAAYTGLLGAGMLVFAAFAQKG
ncbi:MAG: undecaprenyl-diphosphate phosphatase [Coriobacteriia bacterium]|nr:undecaprenyl-diphosphate phosphatase [Coriobacteriia bacterium]